MCSSDLDRYCPKTDGLRPLTVPLSTLGWRAFAVAGPTMFNALPDDLRDPEVSITNNIRTIDEDTFSPPISTFSALGVFHVMRYINVRYLLYLLTYLPLPLLQLFLLCFFV